MTTKTKKYIAYGIGGLIVWLLILKIFVSLGTNRIKDEYKSVKTGVKTNTKEIKHDAQSIKKDNEK